MTTELPEKPLSRKESYLAAIAGEDVTLPDAPESRTEQYLAYIAENGGGGGGGTNNFNQLTNRPKYNGTTMTGSTNIPEVKSYSAGTGLKLTGTAFSVDTTTIQPKLTAGSNVTISDNTISATDTTYSNFTGTDGTAAGVAGLVPAPATTDAGKFLKADGTWDTAGGGGGSYTAGDGIDITNSVISATNTGKAKELTTADYNYPTDNPTYVALWLLDPGVYYRKSDSVAVRWKTAGAGGTDLSNTRTFVIGGDKSGPHVLMAIGSSLVKTTALAVNGTGTEGYPKTYLKTENIIDNLTSTSTFDALSANQGKVLKDLVDSLAFKNAGAPTTSTVGTVGQLLEDTTNGKLYICTDTTGGTYTWAEVGAGGSGPTVVQTTGTSTTDVMSQNAVTSMVFADPATQYKIKIGAGTSASEGANGVEIGHNAGAGEEGVALGYGTYAGAKAIALGHNADARGNGAVAIGDNCNVSGQGIVGIGTVTTSTGYNSSNYRLLTGLYDPQSAHDAATKGYVDTAISGISVGTISNNTLYL